MRTNIDLSNELLFQRFGQGVKLIKPKPIEPGCSLRIADILNMPIHTYFTSRDGKIENINDLCAISAGYHSAKELIGKSLYDIPNVKHEHTDLIVINNQEVMKSNRLKFIEEHVNKEDGSEIQTLSIKLPWYDSDDKIIGIFGWSILIGQQPLAQTLSSLMQLGLLNPTIDFSNNVPPVTGRQLGDVYFSKREFECITLVKQGKSARDMGNILGISHRTVEQYLASIKVKWKVKSKSELIDKASYYCL